MISYVLLSVLALGAGTSGALIGLWGVSSSVPSGGFLALPGLNKPLAWLGALLVGSIVFAIALQFLKHKPEEQVEEKEEEIDLDDLTFSEF